MAQSRDGVVWEGSGGGVSNGIERDTRQDLKKKKTPALGFRGQWFQAFESGCPRGEWVR